MDGEWGLPDSGIRRWEGAQERWVCRASSQENTAVITPARMPVTGWALGQCRQRGLAPAPLPGMVPAGHGQGGGSSLLAWQLPALPSAPSDPAKRELKFSLLLSIGKKP